MANVINNIKRLKIYYYVTNISKLLIPFFFYRNRLNYWIQQAHKYPKEYIESRVNYYVNKNTKKELKEFKLLKNFKTPKGNSQYFFDLAQITKYFDRNYKLAYLFGDITENQAELTIVKSRPINHTGNSVLMKLDSLRHYHFINDPLAFEHKKDIIVWRGKIHKENRRLLVQKFHEHEQCNIGEATNNPLKKEWTKDFLTINEQLQYKFILSIEGIDVATNLKWIMSSNSLCFMPKPKFETWFMEGRLIENKHYVLIKDDYSDMIEKVNYYSKNTKEALKIIKNANDWVEQFTNSRLEKIISILVLNEYFKQTKQKKD